jgi:hypothetical protein
MDHVRFGSKADMCGATQHVCFVPIADIHEFGSHHKKSPGTGF